MPSFARCRPCACVPCLVVCRRVLGCRPGFRESKPSVWRFPVAGQVHATLTSVQQAIRGEVVLTSELAQVMNDVYDAKVRHQGHCRKRCTCMCLYPPDCAIVDG